jgi:hypothetical protein
MIYGGTGVVWAWVIALVLGSSVVVIAYHHEYGIAYRELFPKESFWLVIGSTIGMTAGLLVYYFLYAYLVFPMLMLLCMMAFVLFALLPLWFHPMTARWMRWLSGVQFP